MNSSWLGRAVFMELRIEPAATSKGPQRETWIFGYLRIFLWFSYRYEKQMGPQRETWILGYLRISLWYSYCYEKKLGA